MKAREQSRAFFLGVMGNYQAMAASPAEP